MAVESSRSPTSRSSRAPSVAIDRRNRSVDCRVPGQVGLEQGRGVALDGGERRAELVAERRQQLALDGLGAAQGGRLPPGVLERLALHGQGERAGGVVEQLERVARSGRRRRGGGRRARPGPRGGGGRPRPGRTRRSAPRRRRGPRGWRGPRPGTAARRPPARRRRPSCSTSWLQLAVLLDQHPHRGRAQRPAQRQQTTRPGRRRPGRARPASPASPAATRGRGCGGRPRTAAARARWRPPRSPGRGAPAPAAPARAGRRRWRSPTRCPARRGCPTIGAAHSLRMPDAAAARR